MKRFSFWPVFGGSTLIAASVAGALVLNSFHHFDPVRSGFAGSCEPVSGIAGPEDLQIDETTRRVFISSFDRDSQRAYNTRGGIFAFSIDDPLAADAWRDRTRGEPARFEPLGLHFYSDGIVSRLFVVNAAANTVELYNVEDNGDLTYVETLSERRLTSPNDIVAVGPRSFYVTNDVEAGRDSILGRLQFLTKSGSGKLLYFDGAAWKLAAENLRFANGVNVSNDGNHLYVAETAAAALKIYDRDPMTGLLRSGRTVPMGAAVDNINVDRTGALWIGAHPKPLLLPRYARNPELKAPSMVIRYDDIAGIKSMPAKVYADDGSEISASTAAAKLGSTLLIGSLLEKKFLICELPS